MNRFLLAAGALKCLLACLFLLGPSWTEAVETAAGGKGQDEAGNSDAKAGGSAPTAATPPLDIHPEVLEKIRRTQRELKEREDALEARKQELDLLEGEIAGRIGELTTLQKELQKAGEAAGRQQAGNLEQLVGIYSAMEPDRAALLLDKMDEETVLRIFEGMKSKKVAMVLSLMDSEKAARISSKLAGRSPVASGARERTAAAR